MSVRAIVAEDEPVLRSQLGDLLGRAWPELEVVGVAVDGAQAGALVAQHWPDVLFLDIQMPGLSGLDVARTASSRCHVVFVTAYDQYAVAAFDEGAVDYVMKPVTLERLKIACERVKARLDRPPANLEKILRDLAQHAAHSRPYMRWINLSQDEEVKLVTVEEVCYFQSDARHTLAATKEGRSVVRKTLKDLIDELDPAVFWRVHRSTLVNVNAIAGVTRDLRGRVHIRLKGRPEKLAVSEAYAHLFKPT